MSRRDLAVLTLLALGGGGGCNRSLLIGVVDPDGGPSDALVGDSGAPDLSLLPRLRFAAPRRFDSTAPSALVLFDFNRDRHLDVAVLGAGRGSADVFFGDGAGGLVRSSTQVLCADPVGLVAGSIDYNRDAEPDLATACRTGNSLVVRSGTMNGQFGPGPTVALGATPQSIALGDLDRFDKLDFLLGTAGGVLPFVNGSLRSPLPSPSGTVTRLRMVDFDGDGNLDALGQAGGAALHLYAGDGKGGLTAAGVALAMGEIGGALADFALLDDDGDGKLDLIGAVADPAAGSGLRVARGAGRAFAAPTVCTAKVQPTVLAVADFDGDGHPDVSGGQSAGAALIVFGPIGDATVPVMPLSLDAVVALESGDLDGDGRADLVALRSSDDGVYVLLNRAP